MSIFWLTILMITSGPVMMDDTESYHIQAVKWIQDYGSVPGLVNLHERFGFNSSWFSSIALFNFFPSGFTLYTALNGMISVWFCYYLLLQVCRAESHITLRVANIFVLILLWVLWPLARGNAATSNYDFITTFIVYVLFIETFRQSNQQENNFFSIEWIIWPVFLFTVRMLNYPLLICCLYALFILRKNTKLLWPVIILCTLLMLGFLPRNFIISGYLFYPATEIDVLSADWKPDPALTEKLREYITYYNRVSTKFQDISVTKELGSLGWIPTWFRTMFFYDKIILIPGIMGLITGLFLLKKNQGFSKSVTIMVLTFLLLIISWFIISPDPRFIYGCLLAGIFLLAYKVAMNFDTLLRRTSINIFITASIFFASAYFVYKLINQPSNVNIIQPVELPVPETNNIVINDIIFRIPQKINNNWNSRCYDITLPCLYEIHPNLQPRGKDIKYGFSLKK